MNPCNNCAALKLDRKICIKELCPYCLAIPKVTIIKEILTKPLAPKVI